MAQDVMQKARASQPYRNGSIVTSCDKHGNKVVIVPQFNVVRDDTAAAAILASRFKDYNYYSA